MRILALTLAMALPAAAQTEETTDVFPDEMRDDYAQKIAGYIEYQNWAMLFNEYRAVLDSDEKRAKVMKLKDADGKERYTSVVAYLNHIISTKLPPEAIADYRRRYDDAAWGLFRQAIDEGDPRKFEEVIDRHFFSSKTDEATMHLTSWLIESGRAEDAAHHLDRLLREYPDLDKDIPRSLVAARLVHALELARNTSQLRKTADWLPTQEWLEEVKIAGTDTSPAAYARAAADRPVPVVERRPTRTAPAIDDPIDRAAIIDAYTRNEIRLFTYDFSESDETAATPRGRRQPDPQAVQHGDYPYLPAYAAYGDREMVLATNGARVSAIDPRTGRTYWVFGAGEPEPYTNNMGGRGWGAQAGNGNAHPLMGATIDGDFAYLTLHSQTAPKVTPEANMWGIQFNFPLARRIVCVRLYDRIRDRITREVIWDTDRFYDEIALKKADHNWSFCSPPMVRGDRLYVGMTSQPGGDSESYLCCFDRSTGALLWRTFICSVSGRFSNMNQGRFLGLMPLTMLAQGNGMIYTATHQGAVAALNPVNGSIHWLGLYASGSARNATMFSRPPSAPVLHRGRLYVLPMDVDRLLVYDAMDGSALPTPKITRSSTLLGGSRAGGAWNAYERLLGVVDDHLVLMGKGQSLIIDADADRTYDMYNTSTVSTGAGAVEGSFIYLPIQDESGAKLAVFESGSWKYRYSEAWDDPKESGNVVHAGPYLLVQSPDRLAVYTDSRVLRSWYAPMMAQDPPDLDALYNYGMMMRANNVWEEAAEALLRYMAASEGLASEAARRSATQRDLGVAFLRRGDAAVDAASWNEAVTLYETALGFSSDPEKIAEISLKLGRAYEKLGRPADAVTRYHALREKHPHVVWPSDDGKTDESLWTLTTRRIQALIEQAGVEVYASVEREVVRALREAGDADIQTLEQLLERFPDSRALRDRIAEAAGPILESEAWQEAERVLRRLQQIDPKAFGQELRRKLIDALERDEYFDRAREELRKLRGLFPDAEGSLPERPAAPDAGPVRSLQRIAVLADSKAVAVPSRRQIVAGMRPMKVEGFRPPAWRDAHVLMKNGSTVELWDLETNERVWSRAHPGGALGATLQVVEDGLLVQELVADGPLAKAGLKRNAVILTIDAEPASAARLHAAVRGGKAGDAVKLMVRHPRGPEDERTVTLGAVPPNSWPELVAAMFAADGSLLAVWQDRAASLDLKTGEVRWVRPLQDPATQIGSAAWADGRLYLLTTTVADASRVDVLIPQEPNTQVIAPAVSRVLCIDDLSGSPLWSRELEAGGSYELTARGGWDAVLVRQGGAAGLLSQSQEEMQTQVMLSSIRSRGMQVPQATPQKNSLHVFDGRSGADRIDPIDLGAMLAAFAMDAEAERAVWIDANGDLRAMALPVRSYEKATLDVRRRLTPAHGVQQGANYQLALWRDRVVLLSNAAVAKLWVFKIGEKAIDDVKELALKDGMDLPRQPQVYTAPAVSADGHLFVYAYEKQSDPVGQDFANGFVYRYELEGATATSQGEAYVPGLWMAPGAIDVSIAPLMVFAAPNSRDEDFESQKQAQLLRIYDWSRGGRWIAPSLADVSVQGNWMDAWVVDGRMFFRRGDRLHVYAPSDAEPKPEEPAEGRAPSSPESLFACESCGLLAMAGAAPSCCERPMASRGYDPQQVAREETQRLLQAYQMQLKQVEWSIRE